MSNVGVATDSDGSVIFIGFTPAGLRGLGQYLPDDSVVFIDEPDVLRKREAVANSAGIATLRELIGLELYEIEGAADAFYNANRHRRPAGILPVTDYGVPFAARLAERYGVRGAGYGAARALRDKHLLRQVTRAAGVPNPESVPVTGPADITAFMAGIGGPVVLKPANRQAAVGTKIVYSPTEAAEAWMECMEQEEGEFMPDRPLPLRMLAERYIRGEEFSVEMMFRSGRMAFGGVTRTLLFDGPRPVERGHLYPADIPAQLTERLLADTVRVLDAVGLDSGWTHCEWRVEDGVPFLMECAGRMAGGGIIELIGIASGYDANGAFLGMMLDLDPATPPQADRYAAAWMAGMTPGVVESIDGREDALAVPGVRSCWIRIKAGDQVTSLRSSFDRVMAVRAEGPTPAQALATAQAAMALVSIKLRPTGPLPIWGTVGQCRQDQPMPDDRLTGLYLREAAARGVAPADLPDAAARELDLVEMSFRGRCLSRPVFLGRAEHARLVADLDNFYAALTALPDRRFGGDLGAFARAVGLTAEQAAAVQLAADTPLTRLARADLYRGADGFRLLEINIGSTIGGGDNAMVNRAMLTNPVLAKFVRAHGLSYVDTLAEIADTIAAETGISLGDGSLVAAVMWPPTASRFTGVLQTSAKELAALGLDMVPCHLGHLSVHDHRVWLDKRPVDVIYRIFMIENLLDPAGPALIDPILQAAERGEVKIFTPMHSQLYSSKGALALLSDETSRHLCPPAELDSLDRLLPWTRMLRPGAVTADGGQVDLLDYATGHRADLILKPTARHGGHGIVTGWQTDADDWDRQLRAALGGPFVLQRRIKPEPERFPGPGGLEPWVLTWGAYLGRRGYAGMWVRGEADQDTGGVNMATGAFATCCFHEPGGSG